MPKKSPSRSISAKRKKQSSKEDLKATYRRLVDEMTPSKGMRLSSSDEPLSPHKQKWLNHAFAQVRALKLFATNPMIVEALTNIGTTLILVDSE